MLRRDDESPFFYSPTHTEVVFGGSVGLVGSVGFTGFCQKSPKFNSAG